MNKNVLLKFGEKLVEMFWQSCEAKTFVVYLLSKYSNTTDNDIDDMVVEMVRKKLLKDCPEK